MPKYSVTMQPAGTEILFDRVTVNPDDTYSLHWDHPTLTNGIEVTQTTMTAGDDFDVWRAFIAEHVDPADVS